MFARGLATRNGLRACLLAGVILVSGAIAQVQASTLGTLTVNYAGLTGYSPAGQYNWTKTAGSNATINALFPGGTGNIHTYCVDLQGAGNTTYTVVDTIFGMPAGIPNGSITAVRVQQLGWLVENYGELGNTPLSGPAFVGGLSTNEKFAVFQAAVWELAGTQIYSFTAGNSTANFANMNTSKANLVGLATTFLNYSGYSEFAVTNQFKILGLTSAGQDQIYIVSNPEYLQEVPVPAGVILAGMGIACIGGSNYLRRRKAIAA